MKPLTERRIAGGGSDSGNREMAVTGESGGHKVRNFCRFPFWHSTSTGISSSSSSLGRINQLNQFVDQSSLHSSNTVSAMAKSLIPARRRLSLDPPNKLYFPCKCSMDHSSFGHKCVYSCLVCLCLCMRGYMRILILIFLLVDLWSLGD